MHAGIISYDYRPSIGGLGIIVSQATDKLVSDHPADCFTVFSPSKGAQSLVSPIARSRWSKPGGCPLFSLTLLWTLPTLIATHGLDLVHVHAGSGGVFILRKPRCPMIVTSHHTYRQEARTVFAHEPFKRAWKLFMAKLENRTYRLADHITCVSADTMHELATAYGIDPAKMSVVENAVDVDRYRSLPQTVKAEHTILYVGRIEPRKGVWTLLKAFAELLNTFPQAKLRLVGANLLGESLHTFLSQHKLNGSVDCLGRLEESMLDHELATATVVAVPSIVEGFGLIAGQAMAAGCCVVTSDCPGLRSVVSDGRTGLLFQCEDVGSCRSVLAKALGDSALRASLSLAAKEDALARFTFTLHARRLYESYQRVLSQTA